MHLPTLPTAEELTALQAKLRTAQRPIVTLILNELERALERGHASIVLHGTLPTADKDILCEHSYQIYEHLDQHREITTITWNPLTPEPEGTLYRSNAQAARLLGLAIDPSLKPQAPSPAPEITFIGSEDEMLTFHRDGKHWMTLYAPSPIDANEFEAWLNQVLKPQASSLQPEPPSLQPPAPSLKPEGGTTFQALALLATVGLCFFGALNVTLDRCARAALALQTWLAELPTLTFGAWCVAIVLAWAVSLALAWLVSATWEHERHLNLTKRVKRPKTTPQGEHRFNKFTLTPADQAPLR